MADPVLELLARDEDRTLDELLALFRRPSWHADAACLEHPSSWWFPGRAGGAQAVERARAVCSRCLVADECRTWALDQDDAPDGVWGGLTKLQRVALRRSAA